jgi:hypothetical protein
VNTHIATADTLTLVRDSADHTAVAAGHARVCARQLADEYRRHGGSTAYVSGDVSHAQRCDWCHR